MMLSNEINNDLQQQHNIVLPLHYSSSSSSSYDDYVDSNRRTKTATTRRRRMSKRITITAANVLVVLIMSSIFVMCFLAHRHIENQLRERNRHPLSFPKRKLNEDDGSLKYLTLGGPSTWGQGLDSPQNQAYPYLLSPNVHNAAQRVGGPTLASLCAESIVGPEEIYDVIVLQFESELTSALPLLAQRLRRRFPQAEFVFVNLWSPSRYVAQQQQNEDDEEDGDGHNTSLSIAQWKYSNNETRKDFHDYDWIYKGNNEDEMNALNQVVEATRGKLYQLPPPNPNELSMKIIEEMFLEIHRDEFFDLSYTLSPHGHQVVADGILSLLGDELDLLLAKKKQQGDVDAVVVGDWGDGDSCHIWYDTGLDVPEFSRLIFSRFANNEKYALEVPSPTGGSGDHGGSITINNPFNESRMVYLTYMTTNSASSNKIYPRTKVQFISVNNDDDDSDNKRESSSAAAAVILDPYANDDDGTNKDKSSYHSRHITRTSAVGNMLPGRKTTIRLTPMENTAANFRLVGASLLATEKATHNIASAEFDLGPEAAHVFEVFGPADLDI